MTPWATVKDLFPFRNIKAVVLNLRVATPLGITYQISCTSDIYIMIHNSSKVRVMK